MSLDPYKDPARFLYSSYSANEDESSEMLSNVSHRHQAAGRSCDPDRAGGRHSWRLNNNTKNKSSTSLQSPMLLIFSKLSNCYYYTAAAAAKSLQSCPTLRPQRQQPTRLPCPWDSPGKNTGVGCRFLLQCMKVKSESEVAQLCPTVATPWTAAYQAPQPMGSSRQKYWSGVLLLSPILLY